jgi:glycosyltransferase involved in cell wall biosynthesis
MILACIPCYNEEKTIARVVIGSQKIVDRVLVCDDGSSDLSGIIAERLGAVLIKHEKNMGYGATLRSLFAKAREYSPDIVVTLDADGQHKPADIPKVIKPIIDGEADIVIGSRFVTDSNAIPKYREMGIKALTKATNIASGLNVKDAQSGFRAYNKKALEALRLTEEGMGLSGEILINAATAGLKVVEVPIEIYYEGLDTSTKNPATHGLEVLLSIVKHFSIKHPLLIYGLPSLVLLTIGLFFGAWTVQNYLLNREFPIGLALIATFSTIFGAILGTTAIILYSILSFIKEKK